MTAEIDGIRERCEEDIKFYNRPSPSGQGIGGFPSNVADRIALLTEIDRLEAQKADVWRDFSAMESDHTELQAELATLRRANERMREALERRDSLHEDRGEAIKACFKYQGQLRKIRERVEQLESVEFTNPTDFTAALVCCNDLLTIAEDTR